MKDENVETAVMVAEPEAVPMVFNHDPIKAIEEAQAIISAMSNKCQGDKFIANIQGKKYPKVEWWTTVGAVKGLFPYLVSNVRLDREDELIYEARVEIRNVLNQQAITSAEAVCSSKESRWRGRDEYAIKSMAQTRATAKAYRIGLSFLAVMAGLEPTPAEEVPSEGFNHAPQAPASANKANPVPIRKLNTGGKEPLPNLTPEQRVRSEKEFRLREFVCACCDVQNPSKPTPEEAKNLSEKFKEMTGKEKMTDLSDAELDEQLNKSEVKMFESIGGTGEKY